MKKSIVSVCVVLQGILAGVILDWYYYPVPLSNSIEMNPDFYTRGQMHYLNMDAGMFSCWSTTIKKFLQLSCPHVMMNSDLSVELAYLLTSCYCISIGMAQLSCRSSSSRDNEKYYHFSLVDCAKEKCYNKYDEDAFEINFSRLSDLCHYILYEADVNPEKMNPYITYDELERLNRIANGEDETIGFDAELQVLSRIITEKIQQRQTGAKFWFKKQWKEFWMIVDDLKFKFRLGKYSNVPYYEFMKIEN